MIEPDLIASVTGSRTDQLFGHLALVDTDQAQALTFLDDERFSQRLIDNPAIAGVFVTRELAQGLRDRRGELSLLEHEDPRWAYFSLYNHIAERDYLRVPSSISSEADIHPRAWVSEYNVMIGPGTKVDPFVAILADVRIGGKCHIQAGTVIGSIGFELKRTSRGIISVFHDGIVEIEDEVEIGANTCIDKGFRGRPTLIARGARIDNLVHVAHSARVGAGAFVVAGTVIGGSTVIGDEAWLSINSSIAPSLTVGRRSFVSMGAVVTRDVPPETQVTGNLAVPHKTFLKMFKDGLKRVAGD